MTDTGWLTPGSATTDGAGTIWSGNGSNARSDDGIATTASNVSVNTETLLCTNYFLTPLPANARINGVETRVEHKGILAFGSGTCEYQVQLYNAGKVLTAISNEKTTSQNPAFSYTNWDKGGATDLWGIPGIGLFDLFPENFNSSTFGVGFRLDIGTFTATATINVDHVSVKVYYTVGDLKTRLKGGSLLGKTTLGGI